MFLHKLEHLPFLCLASSRSYTLSVTPFCSSLVPLIESQNPFIEFPKLKYQSPRPGP
jgi:hypothetical protein